MDTTQERINLGKWDSAGLSRMLAAAYVIEDLFERAEHISRQFLSIPYVESTLVGSAETPEELVIRLDAVDCFTYIDYVEAMKLSRSFDGFKEELKRVRYRQGRVSYATRNHFFTDWLEGFRVRDVTARVGGREARKVRKVLNRKDDGTSFLPGIPEREREITFIPPTALKDDAVLDRLETGDYVGIYSEVEGLDCSHVGIIVRQQGDIVFRHASLIEGMVVDQWFRKYVSGKPGILVLRPEA